MNDAATPPATPWDFKARAFVFSVIYAISFFVGINLQYNVFGNIRPTYFYLGERWGMPGIHAAAFIPVLFALAALVLRAWGTAYLSSGIVWSASVTSSGLLLSGPYRYVRNPLYLGNVLGAIGIGMVGPPFSLLLAVAGVTLFVLRLIGIEERYLSSVHGQAYRGYRSMVPRLLPRMRPTPVGADPRPPAWSDGFWGEIFHLAVVIALAYNALFTWEEPGAILWMILVGALALCAILRRLAFGKSIATA